MRDIFEYKVSSLLDPVMNGKVNFPVVILETKMVHWVVSGMIESVVVETLPPKWTIRKKKIQE
jgi:hypothetical protein